MTDDSREKKPDPIDVHVGKRIRARRMLTGISQTELAAVLGVSQQQVQKYEQGITRISPSRLQRVADALEHPAAQFFEGAPGARVRPMRAQPINDDDVIQFLATVEGVDLNRAFLRIREGSIRRSIVELANALSTPDIETSSLNDCEIATL